VSLLVDKSVWSLALRRDVEQSAPEVVSLRHALLGTDQVFTTGLVLQELLQGFAGPKAEPSWSIASQRSPSSSQLRKITSKQQKSETPAVVAAFRLAPLTLYSSSSVAETI
jgi:hypothetical protein